MGDKINPTVEALDSGIVEGLKFQIKSGELSELMRGRAAYHQERAAKKRAEIPNLKKTIETLKTGTPSTVSVMSKASNYSADPDDLLEQLENDIRTHENRSVSLTFQADHVIPDKKYILTDSDLRQIEIVR